MEEYYSWAQVISYAVVLNHLLLSMYVLPDVKEGTG